MFLFLSILMCLCVLIYYSKERNITRMILFTSIILGVLAFFQTVDDQSDLTTAFYHLDNIREQGWDYFSNISTRTGYFTGRFTLQIYFYLLSFLPFNNFYPAISMFVMYWCILTAIHDVSAYFGSSYHTEKLMLILSIFLVDFYGASNGVRNMLAFSIFIFAFVEDFLNNRSKGVCWAMYVVALFTHTAVWPLFIFRLLLLLKRGWLKVLIGVLTVAWSYAIENISTILLMFNGSPIAESILHGLSAYTEGTGTNYAETAFNMSSSYLMMRNFRLLLAVVLIALIIVSWRRTSNLSELMTYSLYAVAFTVGASAAGLATNILTRYSYAIIILVPIVYCEYSTLSFPKKRLGVGKRSIEVFGAALLICMILFNYYYCRYLYPSLEFSFEFIS